LVGIAVSFFANNMYSAVIGFWSVEELAELAGGQLLVVKWRGVGVYLLGTSV
jgi:hypothetical protein